MERPESPSERSDAKARGHPGFSAGARRLHWILRFVHNLYAAGGLMLVLGLAASVFVLWALSALTEEVLAGETLRMDAVAIQYLSGFATDRLDVRAMEVTALGGGTVVLTMSVIAASLLALLGRRYYAILVVAAVSGGWVLSPVLKALFDRDRPGAAEWRIPYAGHSSFPSGHAMMGMVLYVTLAYIIHRLANRAWVSALSILLAGVVVALIGVTRVYLGVHYPSDVLAGYAVGFTWAMACAAAIELLREARWRDTSDEARPTDAA